MAVDYRKDFFNVDEEDIFKAFEKYDMTKNMVLDRVLEIRNWYNSQPHLPENALEDRLVMRFLYILKNSTERTKQNIDYYYTCRSMFPEFFSNRYLDYTTIMDFIPLLDVAFIPTLTKESYRISVMKPTDNDNVNYLNQAHLAKFALMVYDIKLHYDVCEGEIIVWDLTKLTLSRVKKASITLLRKVGFILRVSYPFQLKELHILNCPGYAKSILNFILTMMKEKISGRVIHHNSLEELHKCIDPKLLPKDLGGEQLTCAENIECAIKIVQSEEWKAWFKQSESLKSDESKRIEKLDDSFEELMGISGSFRKLEID